MRHGAVLFASDRGITPAEAARAAEGVGFATFSVPEHTHIPVRCAAAHPGTGYATLPDDRDARTLDPWVASATADVLGIQVPAAHRAGELDDAALREIVIFVCHYAGWPVGARLDTIVEETPGRGRRDTGTGTGT